MCFLISRRELLENFDGWGPAKKDLLGFEEKFDPMPLFEDAMDGVRDVQRVVVNLRLEEALAAAARIEASVVIEGNRLQGAVTTQGGETVAGGLRRNDDPAASGWHLERKLASLEVHHCH